MLGMLVRRGWTHEIQLFKTIIILLLYLRERICRVSRNNLEFTLSYMYSLLYVTWLNRQANISLSNCVSENAPIPKTTCLYERIGCTKISVHNKWNDTLVTKQQLLYTWINSRMGLVVNWNWNPIVYI